MAIDLLAKARKDAQNITIGAFGVDLTLTPPAGSPVSVRGLASKHHLQIDPETGFYVNVKNTHVNISESSLVALSYPIRNANNEVAMKGHVISYADSSGNVASYKIDETRPDETLGLIICILGDYIP